MHLESGFPVVDPSGPYGYAEMIADLERLCGRYPFLQIEPIGYTVLGRLIPAIRLGSGRKRVHYNGAFHANEWITAPLLMKFIEEAADALSSDGLLYGLSAVRLFSEATLWTVPMVNPDGVELVLKGADPNHPYAPCLVHWNGGSADFTGWKANIRGVDLNDQFPANWEAERERRGQAGPGPRDYPGTAPLTEPEAAAMLRFACSGNFDRVFAFHSQGREIYWNYRGFEPPEAEADAHRLAAVSGYQAVSLTGSDAGFKDWFIQEFRRPGFTVEVGYGVNPLPASQFPELYREIAGLMVEGLLLD